MPNIHLRVVAGLLALLPAIASAQTPAPSVPLPSIALPHELDRVLRDYERAWQAGNAVALVPVHHGWLCPLQRETRRVPKWLRLPRLIGRPAPLVAKSLYGGNLAIEVSLGLPLFHYMRIESVI